MKIETKYEVGQKCYVKEGGEWWQGGIVGLSHNGAEWYYEIYVTEIYRYFRQTEVELTINEPEDFQKSNEFLNFFPEFDPQEKAELAKLIRRLQRDAAKRTTATNKETKPTP